MVLDYALPSSTTSRRPGKSGLRRFKDTGIDPIRARAIAQRLRWKEQFHLKEQFKGIVPENYKLAIDAIASRIKTS